MPQRNNKKLGILLMIVTTFIFAVQDGISRHLASEYNVLMVVMIRYWFFAIFVLLFAKIRAGDIRNIARTKQPFLQITRGLLLVGEICVMVTAFVYLGLVESMAIFTAYPLIVAALSQVILKESVGWRRWSAIAIGFIGVLLIINPSRDVFSPYIFIPLTSAFMFALYNLLTRLAAQHDSAETSFFWTGIAGAIGISFIGVFYLEPMTYSDYGWMLCLCITGVLGHYILIRALEIAEASSLQPFAYFHFVFGASIGFFIFGEILSITIIIGALIVISAGLFTIWRGKTSSFKMKIIIIVHAFIKL